MTTVKLDIETDPNLVEPFSDYLIGLFDAAIEFGVSDKDGPIILQAFLERDLATKKETDRLAVQISAYGKDLADVFSCPVPTVSAEILENQDWAENWKAYFKPFEIVPGLVIVPTWETYQAVVDEQVIVMDPGMAFGTGQHATTRLCLELLLELKSVSAGGTMLDVGTGTGILGMAALLSGAFRVVAIDNDPEAVKAAQANCSLNNLSDKMEISDTDLKDIDTIFQVVTANIVHDVLLELSDDLARVTADGGYLLLSGLIEGEQSANIVHCFEQKGFLLAGKRTAEDWCSLLLEKTES